MSTAKKKDKMVPLPLRVPESVAKELKTEAKEKGQPVSKIALSRIQHHQNSLTPELMVHLQNIVNTAANSQYIASKASLSDNKMADVSGADLVIQAGYNPLAGIVVITKMPGSSLEALTGKPANSERAMYLYDYLAYNYPSKVKAGYGCQEYTRFLNYANPIVQERNSNSKKLAKFNKEQEKNKTARAKSLANYKATGMSGWDTSYNVLKALMESSETSQK